MSPVAVTFGRTFGRLRSLFSTALATTVFLAVSAFVFASNLGEAEGGRQTLAFVWAISISPFLPALAAFLAMDTWSDELRTGRVDFLLSIPVRERDLVLGKFAGAWLACLATVCFHLVVTLIALAVFAPSVFAGARFVSFAPACLILLLQASLWCALTVALSAFFTHAAAAACASVALTIALPRGVWKALLLWAPHGRTAFGEMPLDAHVTDFAAGSVSLGIVAVYVVLLAMALFLATKRIASLRFAGRGGFQGRFSTFVVSVLALACAASVSLLALRLDLTLEVPVSDAVALSPRMRHLLSGASGNLTATCFLPRGDSAFRSVARFLRTLKREADAQGGVRFDLRFVDPRWDLGPAERLIRLGAAERSLVFEKGRRCAVVPMGDDFGERAVASAIQSIALPPQRRDVYWSVGHGESQFDAYGTWGMSDIARELAQGGYRNLPIDLARTEAIPADCALLVVAGARDDFSRAELGRVDAYLKGGGRMLVLMSPPGQGGVASLLPAWGMRPVVQSLDDARTVSGSDVIVSDLADHAISSVLSGSRIVLEKPLSFVSSAAAESGTGADRIEFSAVARVGTASVVAAIERGAGTGSDLALRPTRIVAIGDGTFVMNGQLAARANANRDFFLNAVAYLSGTDASGASGQTSEALVSGMDRDTRLRFTALTAVVIPGLAFLVHILAVIRRRRRA